MALLRLFTGAATLIAVCVLPVGIQELINPWIVNNTLAWLLTIAICLSVAITNVLIAWKLSLLGFEKYFRGVYINGRLLVCLQCGYNLHGSTSDTCPECGAIVLVELEGDE